jgi:mevalonate kinase
MSGLKRKIGELSDVDFSLPSEVEVAMDEVASALISEFELDEDEDVYWGRTPSLFEVVAELVEREKVPEEAEDLCEEIRDLLKQAYDDELDEEDSDAMEEALERLQKLLVEALKLE